MSNTDPKTLPDDVKKKLLGIRKALLQSNIRTAYDILYTIACPDFAGHDPWSVFKTGEKTSKQGGGSD